MADPEPLSVGVRSDNDVLTFILPLCEGEEITLAEVTPFDAESTPPPVWKAHGFKGDPTGPVALTQEAWSSVSGSYKGERDASYDFETNGYWSGARLENANDYSGLPPGKYDVEGKRMTLREYREYIEPQIECSSTSTEGAIHAG